VAIVVLEGRLRRPAILLSEGDRCDQFERLVSGNAASELPLRQRDRVSSVLRVLCSIRAMQLIRATFLSLLIVSCSLLSPDASESGWFSLFDGQSLNGWVTTGGRYDGHASWSIADGAIMGQEGPNHAGGLLYTAREYKNFEIELETMITYPFDSGIFLRMTPDAKGAQVTLDYRPTGEVGGIYSEGWYYHNPRGTELFKRDQWNRFRVRCVGDPMHVTVWMNGELLTDYRFAHDAEGFAQTGKIGLQVHGSRDDPPGSNVKFRNIRVKELAEAAGSYFESTPEGVRLLTDEGRAAGWQSLFNRADLTGWEPAPPGTGYEVRGGELAFLTAGESPELRTVEDFRDFHLQLDFKISQLANSGLFLRAARDGSNPAYSGCEVQILDDFNWERLTQTTLEPWQFTGSLYGAVEPGVKDALRPLGEWNTYEVLYKGSRLVTSLNGRVLYDVDTFELDVEPPFAKRAKTGFIGLQRHAPGGELESDTYARFRNIFIRRL